MNDIFTYSLWVRGQISEAEINALSPLRMSVTRLSPAATQLSFCTDQSGLVGLLRHLHGLGIVFLSVSRIEG
jgi:hypothetical protein